MGYTWKQTEFNYIWMENSQMLMKWHLYSYLKFIVILLL